MASLSNVYRLIDDYGTSAGPTGGQTGGASADVLSPDFTAPTIAAAYITAYQFATIFQRPVRLVPVGSAPPYTLVTGISATVALTGTPSGIGY